MVVTGKCPGCQKVALRPTVKVAEPNSMFSDFSAMVLYIQCSSCNTILGAQLDPRAQAEFVRLALKAR